MPSSTDPTLEAFFNEWKTYRLFKDSNFLHHREVADILQRELVERDASFSFLDLAAGDASASSKFLRGTRITSYTAVDFSNPALELARDNTSALPCPKNFLKQDFADFAEMTEACFDIIYLGLSLHHQSNSKKRQTLSALHKLTAPGGYLYLFEPILADGETREQLLPRWKVYLDTFPAALPPEARETVWQHVHTWDFPETLDEYLSSACAAGFQKPACLFTDPHRLYSLMKFQRI